MQIMNHAAADQMRQINAMLQQALGTMGEPTSNLSTPSKTTSQSYIPDFSTNLFEGRRITKPLDPEYLNYIRDRNKKPPFETSRSTGIAHWNPDSGAMGYVETLYQNILGRSPNAEEMDGNGSVYNDAQRIKKEGLAPVIRDMMNSPEFKNKNLSPEEEIQVAYKAILNREATPEEIEAQMQPQEGPFQISVVDKLLGSDEYKQMVKEGKAPPPGPSNSNGESDGEVDPFNQGSIGDCWMLASINAVAKDKEGREILKKSIRQMPNGDYQVKFAGDPNNDTYIVTQYDLENPNYSDHDLDTRILEVAADQWRRRNNYQSLPGGFGKEGIELLTGQTTERIMTDSERVTADEIKQKLLEYEKNDKDGLTLTAALRGNFRGLNFGEGGHVLTIVDIDPITNKVYYQNPWHTGQTESMDLDEFSKIMEEQGREIAYQETNDAEIEWPEIPTF